MAGSGNGSGGGSGSSYVASLGGGSGNSTEYVASLKAQMDGTFEQMLSLMQKAEDSALDLNTGMASAASSINTAVEKLEKLGTSSEHMKLRTTVLLGAFTALTTGLYNFIKSTAAAELNMKKLAKQQHKSVEQTRASDKALEAMGKTLKEVKADKELNKVYKELVKINSEMALPNIDSVLGSVKDLRNSFWQLKDTVKYAVDWIGARVLSNLEDPIKRITGKLKTVANWLKFNLDSVTIKISSGITAFVKGVISLVEGFTTLMTKISQVDPAIRKIGTAILYIYALLKSGPIGALMTLITAIGGVIDDAENYKYNQEKGLDADKNRYKDTKGNTLTAEEAAALRKKGKEVYEYVPIAFTGIWDIRFGKAGEGKSPDEKFASVFDLLFKTLNEKMAELIESMKSFDLFDALFGGKDAGEVGEKTRTWLTTLNEVLNQKETQEQMKQFGSNLFNLLVQGITFTGQTVSDLAAAVASIFKEGGDGENAGFWDKLTEELDNGAIPTAAASGAMLKALGFSDPVALIGGLVGGINDAYQKAKEEVAQSMSEDDPLFDQTVLSKMGSNLDGELQTLGEIIVKGLQSAFATVSVAGDLAGAALTGLVKAALGLLPGKDWSEVVDSALGNLDGGDGKGNGLWSTLAAGIAGKLIGGDGVGLIAAISEALAQYANEDGLERLKGDFESIKETVATLWYGTWDKVDESGNPLAGAQRKDNGLASMLRKIWFGENGQSGLRQEFDKLWNGEDGQSGLHKMLTDTWGKISEAVDKWWNGERQYDERGFELNKRKGAFKDTLLELFFGDGKNVDPLGIVSSLESWWKNSGIEDAVIGWADDIWEGPEKSGKREGGLKELLFGKDWEKGKEFGDGSVADSVVDWFNGVIDSIIALASDRSSELWTAFFNSLPDSIQKTLIVHGIVPEVPGASTPETDSEGNVTVDENGNVKMNSPTGSFTLSEQDLADFGEYLRYVIPDGNGNFKYTGPLSEANIMGSDLYDFGIEPLLYFAKKDNYSGDELARLKKSALGEWNRLLKQSGLINGGKNPLTSLFGGAGAEDAGEDVDNSPITFDAGDEDDRALQERKRQQRLKNRAGHYGDNSQEEPLTSEAENAEEATGSLTEGFTKATEQATAATEEVENLTDTTEQATDQAELLAEEAENVETHLEESVNKADDVATKISDAKDSADELAESLGKAKGVLDSVATAAKAAKNAVKAVADALSDPFKGTVEFTVDDSEVQSYEPPDKYATVHYSVSAPGGGLFGGLAGALGAAVGRAMGGRIGSEMNNLTVGEDGPEYIIPITKPARALQLLKQMFGEMGSSMLSQLADDFGIGVSAGTVGADTASIATAMGGANNTITNNNNVSAPVNIYVTASGVGAEDVGERAYDAAQRHMLRTLRGVFA